MIPFVYYNKIVMNMLLNAGICHDALWPRRPSHLSLSSTLRIVRSSVQKPRPIPLVRPIVFPSTTSRMKLSNVTHPCVLSSVAPRRICLS